MERLEVAMAKARAARQLAREKAGKTPQSGAGKSGRRADRGLGDWSALRPLEISQRTARNRRLSAMLGPDAAAPYDVLRARVLRQMKEAGWTRLAVTSPNKHCGKTTISLNLALSLSRQPELKVILLDFDLRRPALATLLRYGADARIASLLDGSRDFAEYAVRVGPNLALCLNQIRVENSSELLQSQRTGEIIDEIEERWKPDLMIFDTPPMQGIDDNLNFLIQVDCALLVGAAGSTTLSQIDTCEKELSGITNVVGVVLNKCKYLEKDVGYDSSYY